VVAARSLSLLTLNLITRQLRKDFRVPSRSAFLACTDPTAHEQGLDGDLTRRERPFWVSATEKIVAYADPIAREDPPDELGTLGTAFHRLCSSLRQIGFRIVQSSSAWPRWALCSLPWSGPLLGQRSRTMMRRHRWA
jgi:hypothetical protein